MLIILDNMKNLIIFLLLIICSNNLLAQSSGDLNFENNIFYNSNFWIDSSQQNIWQIGRPQKLFFDSAFSRSKSIVTDTINNYPINCISSFTLSLHNINNGNPDFFPGVPYIIFIHKFDTDSLYDGGFIEVSYNSGTTWNNILLDSITNFNNNPETGFEQFDNNFYTINDTIIGGIPAFTGKSNGWVQTMFQWDGCFYTWHIDSILIRFTFKSDTINNAKEGWLIDNLQFGTYECESISKIQQSHLKIYPVLANDKLTIENSFLEKNTIAMVDIKGNVIFRENNISEKLVVDVSKLKKGIYFVKFSTDKFTESKKIIIN